MIVGGSKKEVIKNIQKNILDNELNKKVEINDAVLTPEESEKILKNFYKNRKNKVRFWFRNKRCYAYLRYIDLKIHKYIEIEGLENLKDIKDGAIITNNHFNPLDSMIVRKLIRKRYHKNMYIVSQETNLLLPGFLKYLVNNLNIIPLSKSTNYMIETFKPNLKKVLDKKNYVLIYPEEEMWFNYRKPRPCKRGAYHFASEMNVPIISCFTEMVDLNTPDNDEFNQVKYIIHVLKPIYPDSQKSVRSSSIEMAEKDYKQKVEAYEKIYNKKLDYSFSYDDIAGWR